MQSFPRSAHCLLRASVHRRVSKANSTAGSISQEEYDEYWMSCDPIEFGMCSSCCYIAGHGHDALRPRIHQEDVGSSQDVGKQEIDPKRPKAKRETKGEEPSPVYATRESIKEGRHVHTAEAKDASGAQSDDDEESSRGSENDDEDTSTPLVTLKPNRRQEGLNDGTAGNVVSDGPITRTCQLPSEMSDGAGDRARTGSPPPAP